MPTLDLGRPEIADYMVDSALFWLKNFEFDGFRHDATKHIPENFTRLLTKKIRAQISTKRGKNTYQIGETYGDPKLISSYVGSGLLDAQFDFNLYDRMVDVFAFGDPMDKLVEEQNRTLETYGYHHLMGNITGNQDRTRFISFADGSIDRSTDWMELKRIGHLRDLPHNGNAGFERFGMFYAYQMTAPGIPVIYYGDEFGMTGANDPGNRNPMKFEGLTRQEAALKSWVISCVDFRRSSMAMMYGDFEWLFNDSDRVIIRRTYRNETVITIINRSQEDFAWSASNGFESYGKLVKQIGNGKAFKNPYKVAAGSALMLKFIK
jgi:glycosidase